MDSHAPYRIAWRPPPPVNVRSSSRAAVLDTLEYEFPTSKSRLAARTGLGDTTIRRCCRQLIREGVLTLSYNADPDNGRASDLVTMARYPVLPILEITTRYMVWRLCDTRGDSVFATVRDRDGFCSPEDDLTALMGQVSTILRAGTCGLPAAVPLQAPVLLCPADEIQWLPMVRRVGGDEPSFVLSPEEAAALELRYLPAIRDADAVLHVHTGEVCSVTLLHRSHADDTRSPLVPAAHAPSLRLTLRAYTDGTRPHSDAWWQRIAEFLRGLYRFITPVCVVLETDRAEEGADRLRHALPPTVKLIRAPYALNKPSLAHRGALRLPRRALWDSLESEPPQAKK